MAAYVIADVQVTDPDRYADYTKHVPDSIAGYGGRFLVRGGAFEVVEGDWQPGRVVIIEFPTLEAALGWYRSDDYRELAKIRHEASAAKILVVDGTQ